MNILFISALEIKEKGAQSIRMTLEGYAKAGHQVILLTSKKPRSKDYFYEKEYVPQDSNFKIIHLWLPLGSLAKYSGKINRLRELYLFGIFSFLYGFYLVKKEKIDLIYGYEVRGIIPGYYLAKLFRKKFVSRFQGTILEPLIEKRNIDKKSWRRVWDHRFAFSVPADLYIMTNDGTMGDKVLNFFEASKKKVRFWMNGVNKNIYDSKYQNFIREKYSLPKESVVLITVHRLAAWKKTERAFYALKEVLGKCSKVYLVVVGEGERREFLENLARKLKIEKNIFFAGGISNTEISKYLNGADIYLGTYDLSNAGNPLFEAMLTGLAVISLNNGSTADFLGKGKAGFLINDEKEFAPKIIELADNKKELAKWKNLAKNYSHREFWTWDVRIAQEIKEVEKIVAS